MLEKDQKTVRAVQYSLKRVHSINFALSIVRMFLKCLKITIPFCSNWLFKGINQTCFCQAYNIDNENFPYRYLKEHGFKYI